MKTMQHKRPMGWRQACRRGTVAALAVLLAACATAPQRSAHEEVARSIAERTPGAPGLPEPGQDYLDAAFFAQPLTLERAVRAALVHHPDVRVELARLDAAHAERVQASLLDNPMLSLMGMRPEGGGRWRLEFGLMQSLMDLVRRPQREAEARTRQARVEAEVVLSLLERVRAAETAWVDALAAAELVSLQRDLLALASQRRQLAERLTGSGVAGADALIDTTSALSQAELALRDAEAGLAKARSALASALGLPSAGALQLPARLPAAPTEGIPREALARVAEDHPRLAAARAALAEADAAAALAGRWPGVDRAAVGVGAMREAGGMRMGGPGIEVSLPVFDDGSARRAVAEAGRRAATHALEGERRAVPLAIERALLLLAVAEQAQADQHERLAQLRRLEDLTARRYARGLEDWQASAAAKAAALAAAAALLERRRGVWQALIALEQATAEVVLGQPARAGSD